MQPRQWPILTFHALEDRSDAISFPPRLFERLATGLIEGGFRGVSVGARLAESASSVPVTPAVGLTFDDGFASVYQQAFPLLQRLGLPATVFLTLSARSGLEASERLPAFLGRPMLSWSEIREMTRHGIEIGAHTLTHPDLTRLPLDRVSQEVVKSKAIIEDAIGQPVTAFAYPYGRHNQTVRSLVKRHFRWACSDELGFASDASDPYALARIDAYYLRSTTGVELMTKLGLRRRLGWYLAARGILRRTRRKLEAGLPRTAERSS